MTALRTFVAGATAAALLGTPAVAAEAVAGQPGDASAPAQAQLARYDTSIRFLDTDHTRMYQQGFRVRGQVIAKVGDKRGALAGVRVRLFRKFDGSNRWKYLRSTRTTSTRHPKFHFKANSVANASYKIVFRKTARLQRATGRTHLWVHRQFNSAMRDGAGKAHFHGRMAPRYRHRVIYLEKRSCGTCGWKRVRSKDTTAHSRWRFRVGAPKNGRWWWRVSTPASTRYIRSFSPVFTTEYR